MDEELEGSPVEGLRANTLQGYSRGRYSIARPMNHWYVVAESRELRDKPLSRAIWGVPLVVFRDGEGRPSALLDRCPHRNVPLSLGRVTEGKLECAYHGWRFDGQGDCLHVPSLLDGSSARARNGTPFPTVERDGYVWVYPTSGEKPQREPYAFRLLDDPSYTVVRHVVDSPGTLHATLENALDVPHTQFLHRGLFRSESRGIRITAKVRRQHDRVEAEYIGEPRPTGVVGKILSPSGGLVSHFDRFILPCIAEVEYRIGDENHILVMTAMTPVEDFKTRIHATVAFRLRVPGRMLEPVLKPLALRIFAQDAVMLAQQTEAVRRFGGEQYASTSIDVLGRHIWRLLRQAERGQLEGGDGVLQEDTLELEL